MYPGGAAGRPGLLTCLLPLPRKLDALSFTISKSVSRRGFGGEGWVRGNHFVYPQFTQEGTCAVD